MPPTAAVVPIRAPGPASAQSRECALCDVRRSALFGTLDAGALERIHERIEQVQLAPDDVLFQHGRRGTAVFTVRSGIVRFERATGRGDRRIVRLAGRGDLIGHEALLGRAYADDAVACTPVQLCRISTVLVEALSAGEPGLRRELMSRWQRALEDAEGWLADIATGPARRRLLKLLERLGEHADATGSVWLPRREEIGAMLAMTIETSSRLISRLRREGVIDLPGVRAVRLDRLALRNALRRADDL